jgi:hypothetical protein
MEYNRYNIALLCTSAIYFFVWVAALLVILNLITVNNSRIIDPIGPIYLGIFAAFVLLYPLSFFGSLFFVDINRKKSDKWFLGLPLPIVLLTLILSLLCLYSHLYIAEELFVLLLVLVAPASLLFIQSIPKELRESAEKYIVTAKEISIYAAITGLMYLMHTISLIDDSTVYNIFILMSLLYAVVGLPCIGICLVLMAKEKQPVKSVPKRVHRPSF